MSEVYYYADYNRGKRSSHCNGDATHGAYNTYGVYGEEMKQQQVVLVDGKGTRTVVAGSGPNQSSEPPPITSLTRSRPLLIAIALALILAVFLLVSGVLVYFNYVTYRPRAAPVPEVDGCGGCPPGGECRRISGAWTCTCRTSCPSTSAPVCGTDGNTYQNLCHLRRHSCNTSHQIRVQHPGPCQGEPDPCSGVQCEYGARCVVSGGNAECRCPTSCPAYGDHAGARALCATDATDYPDLCSLHKAACTSHSSIQVKYHGKCDPCSETHCSESEVCRVGESRVAQCMCGESCPLELAPVCGSDGKTYPNECHLRKEACRTGRHMAAIYRGNCESGLNPCSEVDCRFGETCVIDRAGLASCRCDYVCEPVLRPVCGSDGRTYDSECHLHKSACINQTTITLAYHGVCGKEGGCFRLECQLGAVCIERGGVATCECPTCSSEFAPVCGTDGVSYGNECKLTAHACHHHAPNLKPLYKGLCNGCDTLKCEFHSICELDSKGDASCVCPKNCTENTGPPVCGSDGETYGNECHLKRAACENKVNIRLAYIGNCELCAGVKCQYGAKCQAGVCVCPKDCRNSPPEPVCGSDLNTYPSLCHLHAAACSSNATNLDLLFYGGCRHKLNSAQPLRLELKPCNGDKPLVGPDGEDLDCGNGHNRQDCPTDYYCHQTPQFAKCCRKDTGGIYLKSCEDSWFGCCPDNKTPAEGPDNQGCPSLCGCNRIGSYSDWCDGDSGECKCRPGVGGPKCDRCEPGFWGLPKISSGYQGCLACSCSVFGSVRDDCEQMTGRCVCKPGVSGHKCDSCIEPLKVLTPAGCVDADATTPVPTSCSQLNCYFGAICEERDSRAQCACTMSCPKQAKMQVVCGNDGQTYGSECQLKLYACKYQMDISVQYYGPCSAEGLNSGTEGPVRRWTSTNQFTVAGDSGLPLSKSTRHLLPDRYPYSLPGRSKDIYIVESARVTSAASIGSALGESCGHDSECTSVHSMCFAGLCTCKLGFSQDKNICKEDIPSFTGESWMRFRRMKAYHKFSLDLEVKSYNNEGIIFYTQQREDGTGDFISLSIVNGYIQLSYNLGSGAVSVAWTEKIRLGIWHKVRVRRYQRDAMLQVDGGKAVGAKAGGTSTGLDLGHDAWLGWVEGGSNRVWTNAGTQHGLVGCVRLVTALGHPLEAKAVASCDSNPCAANTCKNGGHCVADKLNPQAPACICSQHFTGKNCEERISPCVYNVCGLGSSCHPHPGGAFTCHCPTDQPCQKTRHSESWEFTGKSWIELAKPERVSKAFSIELWFLSSSDDGTILYSGLQSNQHADFISLTLVNGKLRFSFSLGDSLAVLMSNFTLEKNFWHSVLCGRVEGEGFLQINNGSVVRGSTGGQLTELNLDLPLYLGGVPSDIETVEEAWVKSGFIGAVSRVIVNGVGWIGDSPLRTNVELYMGPPCTPGLCKNNGSCQATLNNFVCTCPFGWTGTTCTIATEEESGDVAIRFDGYTILRYPKRKTPLRKNDTLDTNLTDPDWDWETEEYLEEEYFEESELEYPNSSYDDNYNDYQLLYDEKSRGTRVEVSIKTDSKWGTIVVARGKQSAWSLALHDGLPAILLADQPQLTTLTSKVRVNDGIWHQVTAIKRRRSVILQIDEAAPVKLRLPHPSPYPTSRFTIGGGWRNRGKSTEKRYETKLEGCLMRIKINGKPVDITSLLEDNQALQYCNDNHLR